MEKTTAPPGTILAAGGLIGTGLATLALLAPTLVTRLTGGFLPDRLASFDIGLDALGVLFGVAMLVCAVGLIAKGAPFVTWSLALVIVQGLFQLGGAVLEKTLMDGTVALLTVRLMAAVATAVLCLAPLLVAYVVLERRRAAQAPVPPARRGPVLLVAEGLAGFLFLGAAIFVMAVYSRSLAAIYGADASPTALTESRSESPGPPDPLAGSNENEDATPPYGSEPAAADEGGSASAPAAFRTSLASVGGGKRPVWEKGPKATLVDFWASWCGPCLYELSELQQLHERMGDRVRIVLVNTDLEEPEPVREFLARRDIELGSLVDPGGALFQELGLRALPSMFLLDEHGRPVQSYVGAGDPSQLEQDIRDVLERGERKSSRDG